VKAILVTDPRRDVQERLERVLSEHGYDVAGPEPDMVLTPDDGTARFWSRRGVPVYSYDYDEPMDLPGLLAMVRQILDIGGR